MATLCTITSQGVIRVSGADTLAFLQSQLTNDIEALSNDESHLSAWCDPKGRVQVLFRALKQDDDVLLLAPNELAQALLPRLKMFVLRRKVTIEPDTQFAIHALCGDDAEALLNACDVPVPGPDHVDVHDGVLIIGTLAGWLLVGLAAKVDELTQALVGAGAENGAESAWRHACITAGLPVIDSATQGEYVPQMLNLDRLDGISFDKGCYPGQEIVARTQYLGRIKRRTYALDIESGEMPLSGTPLQTDSGASAGKVLNTSAEPGDTQTDGATQSDRQQGERQRGDSATGAVLAVLSSEIAGATSTLRTPDGTRLSLRTLPYPLDA